MALCWRRKVIVALHFWAQKFLLNNRQPISKICFTWRVHIKSLMVTTNNGANEWSVVPVFDRLLGLLVQNLFGCRLINSLLSQLDFPLRDNVAKPTKILKISYLRFKKRLWDAVTSWQFSQSLNRILSYLAKVLLSLVEIFNFVSVTGWNHTWYF
jgi:hypothetical protein